MRMRSCCSDPYHIPEQVDYESMEHIEIKGSFMSSLHERPAPPRCKIRYRCMHCNATITMDGVELSPEDREQLQHQFNARNRIETLKRKHDNEGDEPTGTDVFVRTEY